MVWVYVIFCIYSSVGDGSKVVTKRKLVCFTSCKNKGPWKGTSYEQEEEEEADLWKDYVPYSCACASLIFWRSSYV